MITCRSWIWVKISINNINITIRIEDISGIQYKYKYLTHLNVQDNEIMIEYNMKFLYEMENIIDVNFL
jgi:hypothetical protein